MMDNYDYRQIPGVDAKNRRAEMQFRMSHELMRDIVPLLLPYRVYSRLDDEDKLVLSSPPIAALPTEMPGVAAKQAVKNRLPANWALPDSRLVIQGITKGQNRRYGNTDLFNGVLWHFQLQRDQAYQLGRVIDGVSANPRPLALRLGVNLGTTENDIANMMTHNDIEYRRSRAQEKLSKLGKKAFVFANPTFVDL